MSSSGGSPDVDDEELGVGGTATSAPSAGGGAEFVIENVLPYLLPSDFVRSYVYICNEENS